MTQLLSGTTGHLAVCASVILVALSYSVCSSQLQSSCCCANITPIVREEGEGLRNNPFICLVNVFVEPQGRFPFVCHGQEWSRRVRAKVGTPPFKYGGGVGNGQASDSAWPTSACEILNFRCKTPDHGSPEGRGASSFPCSSLRAGTPHRQRAHS